MTTVTRFGDIPSLWQNFKSLGQFLGLVSIRQTFEPNLANFCAIVAIFVLANCQILKKLSSHLVTLFSVCFQILMYKAKMNATQHKTGKETKAPRQTKFNVHHLDNNHLLDKIFWLKQVYRYAVICISKIGRLARSTSR